MSTKKTIQINPQLFNMKKNKTEKKRTKKEKPLVKSSSLKRELMKRIKTHADNTEKKSENINNSDIEFSNDFEKHMSYLNNLSKDIKSKHRKQNKGTRRSLTKPSNMPAPPSAFLDLPPELNDNTFTININPDEQNVHITSPFQPEPPYGCLKGGDKPTFKDWKRKTQKSVNHNDNDIMIDTNEMIEPPNNDLSNDVDNFLKVNKNVESELIEPIKSVLKINPLLNIQSEREKKLENIKDKFKKKTEYDEINTTVQNVKSKNVPRKFKYNKTVKRTYGKSRGKISVCIKDSQTRKNVIEEQIELRKKPISEIKSYLKDKYLLQSGSHAPNEILRKIYEDVHLAGDITNKNEQSLLHNYINNEL